MQKHKQKTLMTSEQDRDAQYPLDRGIKDKSSTFGGKKEFAQGCDEIVTKSPFHGQ